MEQNVDLLQQYAQQNHQGDRLRAVHCLLHAENLEECSQYIDYFTPEESRFAVSIMEQRCVLHLGGEDNYTAAAKAEAHAKRLGVSVEAVKSHKNNPLIKTCLACFAFLLVSIAVSVALVMLFRDSSWSGLIALGPLLIFLAVFRLGSCALAAWRVHQIRKLPDSIPLMDDEQLQKSPKVSYDDAMQYYGRYVKRQTRYPVAPMEADKATALLDATRKKNWQALLGTLGYFVLLLIAGLLATDCGIVGMVAGIALQLVGFGWTAVGIRKYMRLAACAEGVKADDPQYEAIMKRKKRCVRAAWFILFVYAFLCAVGCVACTEL